MKNFFKKYFSNQQGFTLTPKFGVTCRRQGGFTRAPLNKAGAGFSVIDLMVASAIIAIVFSFVLANFRASQRRGELEGVLKQIISGITTVRNMNLGGQLIANPSPPPTEIFPAGGYGIRFDNIPSPAPDQFILYAVFTPRDPYSPGDEIANGIKPLNDVEFIEFCGLINVAVTSLPCEVPWDTMIPPINPLEIIFSLPNAIIGVPSQDDSGNAFKYLGGKIRHLKTNREAYFYVSLISGLVAGEIL